MKLNGKEVIEIRPMTRGEYINKFGIRNSGCSYCIGLHKIKYCNPKTACSKQPAYVNGKFKMIVKVKVIKMCLGLASGYIEPPEGDLFPISCRKCGRIWIVNEKAAAEMRQQGNICPICRKENGK